jgi:L-amino acid N-acyltransferase YncA
MLNREDFIFTIGYDGPYAVVDKEAKRRYGSLSTRELAERGLYRAAYASAVYARNPENAGGPGAGESDLAALVEIYNRVSGSQLTAASPLDRLFGVFPVEVKRAIIL